MTDRQRQFETIALPHLDAAYNLARWLLRNDQDAQDAVQEAYLRALRYFGGFRGDDARPWLLGIVRNTCYTWLRSAAHGSELVEFDEERDSLGRGAGVDYIENDPERLLLQKLERARIDAAIDSLAPAFREVVVLRDIEGLSYAEISQIAAIPPGTVMSRLARARKLLRAALIEPAGEEDT